MTDSIFNYQHRVTYADCTVGNHVYYARFLDILEATRGEFFRQIGQTFLQLQEAGSIFPVVEVRLKYRAPARYDELLTIELWLTTAERIRLNFAYRVLNARGESIVDAETFHVCTGLDDKPRRIPEEFTKLVASRNQQG